MGIPALFAVNEGIDFGVQIIKGDGPPGGAGGRPDAAVVGSLYLDQTNGNLYTKDQAGSGSEKWVRTQNKDDLDAALLGLSWDEPVLAMDAANYASLAAATTAMNTGTVDGVTVADGSRILFTGITGETPNIFVVNGTPGFGATLAATGNPLQKGNTVYIQDGSVAGRKYSYNGTAWVQIGAAERTELGNIRAFTGKGGEGAEMPDYISTNVVNDGDTLETGIGKLDAEIGVNVTSSKHVAAANDVNTNISILDDVLGDAKTESKTDSVSTATTLDSVKVDDVLAAEWTVHARSATTPGNVWTGKILAIHNGTSAADATDFDYNAFAILKVGSAIPSLEFECDLNGVGAAQEMRLRASSGEATHIRITRAVLNEQ